MCGVAGFLASPRSWEKDRAIHCVQSMCKSIAHRGPDGEGVWVDPSAGIAIGHRRLAIRDLSPAGHQPMISRSGRWVVAFNGELYNHHSIRAELRRLGHEFRGRSDTETLVAACEQWGLADSLPRFAGMFAIALWDSWERRLYLARDRMGEKPLYYGNVGNVFAFASELKALACLPGWTGALDEEAVSAYFERGYIPAPLSIYQGIRKLRPGTWLCVRECDQKELTEVPYWRLEDAILAGQASPVSDPDDAVQLLDHELKQIVGQQMEADVPLGAFLSGGIDSSCVVALMQHQSRCRIRTFTIGFEDPQFDESASARAIAQHLDTDHTEMRVTAHDALSLFPRLSEIYDEPFADQSQLPTILLAKLTREHVTVSLSGDGGDELFAGYAHYPTVLRLWRRIQMWPDALVRQSARVTRNLCSMARSTSRFGYPSARRLSQLQTLSQVLGARNPESIADSLTNPKSNATCSGVSSLSHLDELPAELDPLSRLMAHDLKYWLPDDILVKLDRACMAASLESRAPLLDYRLVELAWRFTGSLKLHKGQSKWLLRKVLERYVPPGLYTRPKQGFCIPMAKWLNGPLKPWVADILRSSNALEIAVQYGLSGNILEPDVPNATVGRQQWAVLMFASWMASQRSNSCRSKAA